MIDDGYVKYKCIWTKTQPVNADMIHDLLVWRQELYHLDIIGAYENGVGFGNVSQRVAQSCEFFVTGTATGTIQQINQNHVSIVTSVDIDENLLQCSGPVKASSEAMTHAAIYAEDETIGGVIHVHNLALWDAFYEVVPTTNPQATYGTPKMARELAKIVREHKKKKNKPLIVMAGHEEGLIAYGKTLDDAGKVILTYMQKIQHKVKHLAVHKDEHEV